MKPTFKIFNYNQDFLRVRDFLSLTFGHYRRSVNWRIERWEYAFHFIAPFLANWGQQPPRRESAEEAIRFLGSLTGIWETADGQIAGVVNIEHPDLTHPGFGEFFIQRHPDHLDLLPEMLNFAEENLIDPAQKRLFIYLDPTEMVLKSLLEEHGFTAFPELTETESVFYLTGKSLPANTDVPDGFLVASMAEHNDLPKRCKAFGLAFDHPDPLEWPSVLSYEYLQTAPDYRKDQDIVVIAPNGEFASFCLIWYDKTNHMASLEPVGTQPEYRHMGLAREAIFEGIRRISARGATRVIVGSSAQFYQKIGFEPNQMLIRYAKFFE
jgi:ribosomal protein S18 acetylase RimI-like enzyme